MPFLTYLAALFAIFNLTGSLLLFFLAYPMLSNTTLPAFRSLYFTIVFTSDYPKIFSFYENI